MRILDDMVRRSLATVIFMAAVLSLSACGGHVPIQPVKGYSPEAGEKAANTAISMIGRPYKYTGETPSGFDCSGLVRYSYLTAGVDLPHGTSYLKQITRTIGFSTARRGDLVFFLQSGKKYSHVGIYVGGGKFVHAPSTGGTVRKDSLGDPYWKKHLLDTRRFI
jgi:cell wall-associated NlpC family hydrolase